jgi:hypothetical protein
MRHTYHIQHTRPCSSKVVLYSFTLRVKNQTNKELKGHIQHTHTGRCSSGVGQD